MGRGSKLGISRSRTISVDLGVRMTDKDNKSYLFGDDWHLCG